MLLIVLFFYLLLINTISFTIFAVDKRKAIKGSWRVPEKTLFILSVPGGAMGALLAMRAFHHKIRKPAFAFGIPAILIIQLVMLAIFFWFYLR